VIQELQDEGPVRPIPITPDGDKITRLMRATGKIEQGYVHLPADAEWMHEFKRELLSFPRSTYKDQVDSLSQYLNWEGLNRRHDMALLTEHMEYCRNLMAADAQRSSLNDPYAPWNW
jgi:phage terminase large subunit-like protein